MLFRDHGMRASVFYGVLEGVFEFEKVSPAGETDVHAVPAIPRLLAAAVDLAACAH
eukprot:COSAG05_NODE_5497_length_1158_cov_338.242682_2_plen_56_part_00